MYFMIVFKVMPHLKESVEVLPLKIIFFPHSLNTLWCPLVYQSTVGGNTFTCPYILNLLSLKLGEESLLKAHHFHS